MFGGFKENAYICTTIYSILLMKKRLLTYSVAVEMLFALPVSMMASEPEQVSVEQTIEDDISSTVNGQWVVINGAQGKTLEVVSLTGRRVMTTKIESPAQRVELNVPKGCYILKIGKVVRKVTVH
jgi:hypothetical protein